MDTEELPDVSADDFQKQFDQPSHTGKDAGDNMVGKSGAGSSKPDFVGSLKDRVGDRAGDSVKTKALGAAASAAGIPGGGALLGKLGKHKGKILLGAVGTVVLIIVLIIAFFLSLFKLKDLQKMFLSYEFAMANHTMAERASEILKEAKANETKPITGDETTPPAPPDAPLDEQLSKGNKAQAEQAQADPAAETQLIERGVQAIDLTGEGTAGEVFAANGVSESGEPSAEEDTAPQEKTNGDVAKEVAAETSAAETGAGVPIDPAIKEGADKAKAEVNDGIPPDQALVDGAKANPEGVLGVSEVLSGSLFASVIYCIAYEIFHAGAQKLAALTTSGLMQFGTSLNVAADKQTEGKLTAAQVGGYNNLIDHTDGTGPSGYSAAAVNRANHKEPAPGTDLASESRPFANAGDGSNIANFIHEAANIPVLGPVSDRACPVLLNPYVQGGLLGLQVGFLISGFFDGGASDAAAVAAKEATKIAIKKAIVKGLLTTGATIAGADALKELVRYEIAKHTGLGVASTSDPIQNVNKWDASDGLVAAESIKRNGAHVLPDDQARAQSQMAFAEQKANITKKGLAYRWLSPDNPYSTTSQVLVRLPSSPQAMIGRMGTFFASLFNPAHLFATLGSLAPIGVANADSYVPPPCPGAAYGIPCYGFTEAQVSRWKFTDNSKYVEAHGLASYKKYDKCFDSKLSDTIGDGGGQTGDFAPGGMCNNDSDIELAHYQMYRLDRRIVQNLVDYGNNTSKSGVSSGSTPSTATAAAGPIYFLGDSILERLNIVGLPTALAAKGYQPATIDFSIGRSITTNGGAIADGNKLSGLDAIAADASTISAAKTIVVELGTNIGDSSDRNTFKVEIGEVFAKLRAANPTAPIDWVNMVSTSNPSYPDRNAALAESAAALHFNVIDARAGIGPSLLEANGIHPTIPEGSSSMRDLIVNALHP